MKEEIEQFKKQESAQEPVIERLEELRKKEIERMEQDPTYGGPWKNIQPEHLITEVQELYDSFVKDQLELVQGKFQQANSIIEKMKDGPIKSSNLGFLHWIDDKIDVARSKKALEQGREKL